MTKVSNLWDRVMFFALLGLVIFIPYSSAMIQGFLLTILVAWLIKHFLLWRANPQKGFYSNFCFPSIGLSWPLIIIAILIVTTIPFSHDSMLSLKKFFSRFLQQIFLMYVTVEIVNTQKRLYAVLVMLLWTLIVVNADVVHQFLSGQSFIFSNHMSYQRVTGPMRHANDLGSLLVTVIPVVLSLTITRRFWMPILFNPRFFVILKVVCISLFLLMVIALGFTTSRGAWVAFILTTIAGGIFLKKYWWTAWTVLLLILYFWIFGIYFTSVRTDIFAKNSIQSEVMVQKKTAIQKDHPTQNKGIIQNETPIENKDLVFADKPAENKFSFQSKKFLDPSRRFEYWNTALKVIKQYPWFGCGYNAYIQTLQKLGLEPIEYPHNSIVHITAELGILGLLAFIWFFVALFTQGLRVLKTIASHREIFLLGTGIFFGLLAWFVHSLFDTPWESLQLNILWWFLIGVLMSLRNIAQQVRVSKEAA